MISHQNNFLKIVNLLKCINVLSLTISAAKTILKTLNSKDNISIVTYSCNAKILFDDLSCNDQNKNIIESELDNLKLLTLS